VRPQLAVLERCITASGSTAPGSSTNTPSSTSIIRGKGVAAAQLPSPTAAPGAAQAPASASQDFADAEDTRVVYTAKVVCAVQRLPGGVQSEHVLGLAAFAPHSDKPRFVSNYMYSHAMITQGP
jgi:hypothetical protein